jgi:DNA polymerase-1
MWRFREIVAADFEFTAPPGERPNPVCMVAHELRSGRRFRLWRDQLGRLPPYATGPDVLFVAYYASAELDCYRVLGWPIPERILYPDSARIRRPPLPNGANRILPTG